MKLWGHEPEIVRRRDFIEVAGATRRHACCSGRCQRKGPAGCLLAFIEGIACTECPVVTGVRFQCIRQGMFRLRQTTALIGQPHRAA